KKEAKADQPDSGQNAEPTVLEDFGLTLTPADDGKGMVVTAVDPGSDAADRGIQAGDVIVAVNSSEVTDMAGIEKAVKSAEDAGRKAVLLQVERDGSNRFVALPVGQG